jgi:hypothetical protein
MRKIIYILGLVSLLGCDSEYAWDCVQSAGDIVEEDYTVEVFKTVQVWERVQLFISKGERQSVRVETGSNLLPEVQVVVEDSILKVSDRNSCNHVREYGITKVYVTTPRNIFQIRNSSGLPVIGEGTLRFEELTLDSTDPQNLDVYHFDGDFILDLNVGRLKIKANGLSKFYLTGRVGFGNFQLTDGDARIEAPELLIENLFVFHRSTNNMILYPRDKIAGKIVGLGDVIAKNRPPIVEVEELWTGRLIFE